jgi:threonyl-tRNA synthetase
VRASKVDKLPYWIVIGDKEIEANMVTLESRDKGNLGQMSIEAVTQKLTEENNSKAY